MTWLPATRFTHKWRLSFRVLAAWQKSACYCTTESMWT